MHRFVLVALSLFLCIASTASLADEVWSFTEEATVSGIPGLVLRIDEVGFPWIEFHAFADAGFYKVTSLREEGDFGWTALGFDFFFCRISSMNIGDSWPFIFTDNGDATTATVKAFETVTVPAGTFNAYRVEVTLNSDPTIKDGVFWFADGAGLVRQEYYDYGLPGNPFDVRLDLISYTIVGGSGYFPSEVGNTWNFADAGVANEGVSWGQLKSLYDN